MTESELLEITGHRSLPKNNIILQISLTALMEPNLGTLKTELNDNQMTRRQEENKKTPPFAVAAGSGLATSPGRIYRSLFKM